MSNQLSPYDQFQLTTYGNILPAIANTKDEDLFESGIEELNRLAEWTEYMNELELITHE